MLELIRSQQKWLMMVIAILVIAAFAFFYDYNNRPQAAGQGGQPFMKVYGKSYSYQETDRLANSGAVAAQMQFFQLAYTLGGLDQRFGGDDPRLRMLDYAANLVILRESAERLGVAVSDAEVDARREEIRSLQTNGVLDAKKWENFVEGVGRFGYGAVDVYEVIRDQITLEKLTALLGANTPAPDFAAEAQYAYRSEFITASQIAFDTEELKKDITATDEEAQAYYDKEKDLALTADELAEIADPEKRKEKMALKTAERRGIDYVFFPHPSEEELKDKSPDEQRKLRNSYATKVNEFFEKTQSMETAEEFAAAAKEIEKPVTPLEPFAQDEPPTDLKTAFTVVGAIFSQDPERPVGDPTDGSDGYYVWFLKAIEEPRLMTFEEAKDKIKEHLVATRTDELLAAKVDEARTKVAEAIKAGKTAEEAAKEAGLEATAIPPFSLGQPPRTPAGRAVATAAADINAGEVSEPIDVPEGKALVIVEKKVLYAKDASAEAQKKSAASQLSASDASAQFREFWKSLKDEADPHPVGFAVRDAS